MLGPLDQGMAPGASPFVPPPPRGRRARSGRSIAALANRRASACTLPPADRSRRSRPAPRSPRRPAPRATPCAEKTTVAPPGTSSSSSTKTAPRSQVGDDVHVVDDLLADEDRRAAAPVRARRSRSPGRPGAERPRPGPQHRTPGKRPAPRVQSAGGGAQLRSARTPSAATCGERRPTPAGSTTTRRTARGRSSHHSMSQRRLHVDGDGAAAGQAGPFLRRGDMVEATDRAPMHAQAAPLQLLLEEHRGRHVDCPRRRLQSARHDDVARAQPRRDGRADPCHRKAGRRRPEGQPLAGDERSPRPHAGAHDVGVEARRRAAPVPRSEGSSDGAARSRCTRASGPAPLTGKTSRYRW